MKKFSLENRIKLLEDVGWLIFTSQVFMFGARSYFQSQGLRPIDRYTYTSFGIMIGGVIGTSIVTTILFPPLLLIPVGYQLYVRYRSNGCSIES